MNYTAHATLRMEQRGITVNNVNWAMQVGYTLQPNGNRRYVRPFGGGNRMFVITNGAGTTVISTWIRGPADTGI